MILATRADVGRDTTAMELHGFTAAYHQDGTSPNRIETGEGKPMAPAKKYMPGLASMPSATDAFPNQGPEQRILNPSFLTLYAEVVVCRS